jgi:uncharacterized protein YxeA
MRKHASAKDGRLWRTYGIREAERARKEKRQHGKCEVCGKSHNVKGEKLTLCVDHDHKARYVKCSTKKCGIASWSAVAEYREETFFGSGKTKSAALKDVRHQLKRRSVRGLICWPCNRAIRAFSDDPVKLRAAAKYLERHQIEACI